MRTTFSGPSRETAAAVSSSESRRTWAGATSHRVPSGDTSEPAGELTNDAASPGAAQFHSPRHARLGLLLAIASAVGVYGGFYFAFARMLGVWPWGAS
jgi:hypothetical protein